MKKKLHLGSGHAKAQVAEVKKKKGYLGVNNKGKQIAKKFTGKCYNYGI